MTFFINKEGHELTYSNLRCHSILVVIIDKFEFPSQQVDYTVGSTNSLLYYSHANITDSALHWTIDTANGTDIQYRFEYTNPVLLSSVFSDVGAGVHKFSCFYGINLVTAVGSIQLAIRGKYYQYTCSIMF